MGFAQAVQAGNGVLLIADPLYEISRAPKNPFSFIVVLARQIENSMEIQVFLTARIYDIGKIRTTIPVLVTFSHKSPFSHETPDELDEIQRVFNNPIEYRMPFANKVHEYVRSNQEMPLKRLLDRQKGLDILMADNGGCTALDWVVVANPPNIAIITILLAQYHDKKTLPITPLILAAAYGNETVIQLLFDFGFTQQFLWGVPSDSSVMVPEVFCYYPPPPYPWRQRKQDRSIWQNSHILRQGIGTFDFVLGHRFTSQ